jgi:hypothetical protein
MTQIVYQGKQVAKMVIKHCGDNDLYFHLVFEDGKTSDTWPLKAGEI